MKQLWTNALQDLRFSFRQSTRRPGLAITCIIALALGLGGSTAVFSVLYQVLLKPLPYPDPNSLVFLHNRFPKGQLGTTGVSGFDYAEIRRHKDVFAEAGVFFWNDLTITGLGPAQHLDVVNVSPSVFNVLGVKPRMGRAFGTRDANPGAPGTAVLSDKLWRTDFGADPNVLGRVIYLNGSAFTVVGVMPPTFQFPSRETQLWIPVALPADSFTLEGGRTEKWLHMVARLAPGVSLERARVVLRTVTAQMAAAYPKLYPANEGWHFTLQAVADEQTETVRRWLYLAFGAVAAVLLIACINVSGLLLIGGTARSGEIAVRRAVGATKSRIIAQMLTETGFLAAFGCALGFLLSAWGLRLVNLYGPIRQPVPLSAAALGFGFVLTLLSTIMAGLLPALLAARLPVDAMLKGGATRITIGNAGLRDAVVAGQIAFAVGLIFTATELNRSFLNLTNVPLGFAADRLWAAALSLPSHTYTANQNWNTGFFEPLLKTLQSLPGVQSASIGNAPPFNPNGVWIEEFHLPERPQINPHPEAQICLPMPGYFETLRIPLLRGRVFTERDRPGAPPVAVIDEELARRYFPGEEPLGKLIASGGAATPATIVGIVGSVHNTDLGAPRVPEVYYPELQERTEATYVVLRMKNDLDPSSAVRQAVAKLDPDAALFDIEFMQARVASSLKLRRFVSFLLNGLAATGLLLALIGLHGSLAHLVELRRREIGIRLALGATQPQLVSMILMRAGVILAPGFGLGALAAAYAGFAVRNQLFGVRPEDPATWGSVFSAAFIASFLLSLLPAWRAARTEPSTALRNE